MRAVLIGLMLTVGSVQAQVSYYCSMMDTVMHDDCCCTDAEVDETMAADSESCCEKTVELFVEVATDQVKTPAKPMKFESDVDPPGVLAAVIAIQFPSLGAASASGAIQAGTYRPGSSATYLITQRLRI